MQETRIISLSGNYNNFPADRAMDNHIQILESLKLDKKRWDDCIAADPDALVYSTSWFLDGMTEEWSGLIVGDYEAVMPLPVKRKAGLKMVAIPPFAQRLGLSGRIPDGMEAVIRKKVFAFSKIFQYAAREIVLWEKTAHRRRTNFILPLEKSYEEIAHNYTKPCRKNISKAENRNCVFTNEVSVATVFRFYKDAYGTAAGYTEKHYQMLENLLNNPGKRISCHISGVKNQEGRLVYAAILMDDGKRLYYILGAPTEEGRQMRAAYFFIDRTIREFAGSGKTFDFEGSDLPNVAVFYQSFSPLTEYYYQIYHNRLPFPFNRILDRRLKRF